MYCNCIDFVFFSAMTHRGYELSWRLFPVFAHVQRHFLFTKSIKSAILFQIINNVFGYTLDNILSSIQKVGSISFPL